MNSSFYSGNRRQRTTLAQMGSYDFHRGRILLSIAFYRKLGYMNFVTGLRHELAKLRARHYA